MTILALVRPNHGYPAGARGVFIETDVYVEPQPDTLRTVASQWHTAVVVAVIAAIAIRGVLLAGQMRTTVNLDRITIYQRTILSEWLTFALVLVGVCLNGSSIFTIIGERWRSFRRFCEDTGIGILFLIASIVFTSIVGGHGGGVDTKTQFLLPQGRAEMAFWIVLSVSAGICEEAVYRGYLQKQFMAMTKSVPTGIVLSGLAFGAAHSYQGWAHASVIATMGVMGGILAYWRRSVRPGMIAHALQDVLGGFVRH